MSANGEPHHQTMSATLNRVYLIGRLANEPELRHSANNSSLCRFRMAVDDSFTSRSGQKVEHVLFVDVSVWGPQAESSHRYLDKGRQVLVEGRLAADEWTDREGRRHSQLRVNATSVQFLGPKPAEAGAPAPADPPPAPPPRDIPFS